MKLLPRPDHSENSFIKSPDSFFGDLGNLHDSQIIEIRWKPTHRQALVVVDDMYANFVGLPEQMGIQPAQIIATNVSKIEMAVENDEFPLRVMDMEAITQPDLSVDIVIKLDPSGSIRINCTAVACIAVSAS